MGSILSAIYDDEREYEYLCRKFGEVVRYKNGMSDCYGEHAKSLARREELELAINRASKENLNRLQT